MHPGYLYVETSASHPGLVRLVTADYLPDTSAPGEADPCIRYVARFSDISTALMHAHDLLRRRLVDLENRIYRSDLLTAIADIEADGLNHQCVYLHPDLKASELSAQLSDRVARLQRRRERIDRIWQTVGWIAIGLLLLNFVFSL